MKHTKYNDGFNSKVKVIPTFMNWWQFLDLLGYRVFWLMMMLVGMVVVVVMEVDGVRWVAECCGNWEDGVDLDGGRDGNEGDGGSHCQTLNSCDSNMLINYHFNWTISPLLKVFWTTNCIFSYQFLIFHWISYLYRSGNILIYRGGIGRTCWIASASFFMFLLAT